MQPFSGQLQAVVRKLGLDCIPKDDTPPSFIAAGGRRETETDPARSSNIGTSQPVLLFHEYVLVTIAVMLPLSLFVVPDLISLF